MTVQEQLRSFLAARPGRDSLAEHEVKELLARIGLPVPRGTLIEGGLTPPLDLSFPLVAKVASSRIAAKTDVGGVRTGIGSLDALGEAVAELARIPGAEGVLVEEQAPAGLEMIVGCITDPQFGPIVMVGLGGILTEFLGDVAFALAPLTRPEAHRLVSRTKGTRLLDGYRGAPPRDREALTGIVVTVSELMGSGLIEEIDLNPVVLYPSGATILDAKLKRLEPSF